MRKAFIACLAILLLGIWGCKTKQNQSGTVDSLSVPIAENLPAGEDMAPLPTTVTTLKEAVALFEKAKIKSDIDIAVEKLRMYSYRNQGEAQFYLGKAYLEGKGVDKSQLEAYYWFTIAARNEYIPAKQKISTIHQHFSKSDLFEISNRADDWFEKYKDRH